METIVLEGQSLFDVAIQECGSVEGAFALAVANNVSISNELPSSESLTKTAITAKRVVDYYNQKELKPATWSTAKEAKLTGIGYMTIEENFTVK
ncbi:hypothetical protein [Dysgonomonas sp. ZJ279]|uniref:hypothetical protein n=1 Tax=Dysgonomonas sp. ZJ279 TaxID=2709796 RepID=UPI0013ED04C5|nr:hypothetical protein [Dysgonomonas sp. ZJ279]